MTQACMYHSAKSHSSDEHKLIISQFICAGKTSFMYFNTSSPFSPMQPV